MESLSTAVAKGFPQPLHPPPVPHSLKSIYTQLEQESAVSKTAKEMKVCCFFLIVLYALLLVAAVTPNSAL